MPTYSLSINLNTPSGQLPASITATGDTSVEAAYTIASSATNYHIVFPAPKANMQCIEFLATAAMTVKTNSSSAPQETITLAANVPYVWITGNGSNPLGGDLTDLYVTSTPGGTLNARVLYNHTP